MTRHDLVGLTLDQLLRNFASAPEGLDLEVVEAKSYPAGPSDAIIWKPTVDNDGLRPDPNNASRTVVVINNKTTKTIQCLIFFKDMQTASNAMSHKPDGLIDAPVGWFKALNSNHRKFMKLRKLIIANSSARENNGFLSKLHSVFPGTFDEFIFGKK